MYIHTFSSSRTLCGGARPGKYCYYNYLYHTAALLCLGIADLKGTLLQTHETFELCLWDDNAFVRPMV